MLAICLQSQVRDAQCHCQWNAKSNKFHLKGYGQSEEGVSKNYLKLYSGTGEMLQMVKVPGNEIFDCSWDRSGLRLALAVDSYIFFASVKPHYQWGYLTNSVVFALPSHNGQGRSKKLLFRELNTNETYEKDVNNFCLLTTWMYCCAVVSKADSTALSGDSKRQEPCSLALYNSVGTLIDRHLVTLKVRHCCLNSSRMVVASEDSFYVWTFNQPFNSGNLKSEWTMRQWPDRECTEIADEGPFLHFLLCCLFFCRCPQ